MGSMTGDIQTLNPAGGAVAGHLPGNTSGAGIGPGFVGQLIESSIPVGSAVPLTTATPANVTSVVLTAGNWWIYGQVDYLLAAATATSFQTGSSQNSATFAAQGGGGGNPPESFTVSPFSFAASSVTISLPAGKPGYQITGSGLTVYLLAQATFSAGAVSAYGTITALRYA